jgi:hypothetical protein
MYSGEFGFRLLALTNHLPIFTFPSLKRSVLYPSTGTWEGCTLTGLPPISTFPSLKLRRNRSFTGEWERCAVFPIRLPAVPRGAPMNGFWNESVDIWLPVGSRRVGITRQSAGVLTSG